MTGESTWLDVIVVFGGAGIVLALLFLFAWQPWTRRRVLHVRCGPKDKLAETTMIQDTRSGRFLNVVTCSLLDEPDHVTCNQDCRKAINEHTEHLVPIR